VPLDFSKMTLSIVTSGGIVPSLKRTHVDSIETTSDRNNLMS